MPEKPSLKLYMDNIEAATIDLWSEVSLREEKLKEGLKFVSDNPDHPSLTEFEARLTKLCKELTELQFWLSFPEVMKSTQSDWIVLQGHDIHGLTHTKVALTDEYVILGEVPFSGALAIQMVRKVIENSVLRGR